MDSTGGQGNAASDTCALSSDASVVAFRSDANNLVPNDTNGNQDVFVRERATGQIERVSVATGGGEAIGGSSDAPTLSADGRFVVFDSDATNLVANDTNGQSDVFVHDRGNGTTTRVSVDSAGTQGIGAAAESAGISGDGRFVVFDSGMTNLVPSDTNGAVDIFLHDRQTGQTSRISVDSAGNQANGDSDNPFISSDGGIVAFASDATNLVPNDTNGVRDIFIRNLVAGTTTRVSISSTGTEGNGDSEVGIEFHAQTCSPDGRFIVFESVATNLVNPPTPAGVSQVYLHDRINQGTMLLSSDVNGVPGNADSFTPFASAEGRFAVFASSASNLVANDTNGTFDVFLRDLVGGTLQIISVDATGVHGNASSAFPLFSTDGRFIGFESSASNLVPNDTNGVRDVFVIRNPLVP